MSRTTWRDAYEAGLRALGTELERAGVLSHSPAHAFLTATKVVLVRRQSEDVLGPLVPPTIFEPSAAEYLQTQPEGDSSIFCLVYLRVQWRSWMSYHHESLAGLLDIEPWVLAHLLRGEAGDQRWFPRGAASTTVRIGGSDFYVRRVGSGRLTVDKPRVEPMRSRESFVIAGVPLPDV